MLNRLLIIHGGGPTCVLNASTYGVIREAQKHPEKIDGVFGCMGGVGGLLGGAIITEQVFVINGVGTYLITAINNRNYPVVQSTVLVIATIFILINLAVDILYCVIDPRISYE